MKCTKCENTDIRISTYTNFRLGQKEKVVWRKRFECIYCANEWEES